MAFEVIAPFDGWAITSFFVVTFLVNAKFLNLMQIFTGKSKTYFDVAFSQTNLKLLILLFSIIQNPHPARNTQFKSDIFFYSQAVLDSLFALALPTSLLQSSTNLIFLSNTAHFSSLEWALWL
ncbi:hypothetical protein [Pseudobutyrivibrio sp. OR37]|uniref:hypothetical protein n=1 Tax=Pseudobutyrivibrio sp. OR37 TaxID=1798186 RepID=UPI000B83EB0A|nr:hypothetical protein [Pseudobutyrivibrio sp. OR37]